MTKPPQIPCTCRAYPFPHRLFGGKCWDELRRPEYEGPCEYKYRPGDNQDDCQAWHDFEARQFDREQGRGR